MGRLSYRPRPVARRDEAGTTIKADAVPLYIPVGGNEGMTMVHWRPWGAGDADRPGGSFERLLKHRNPVNGCFGFLLVGSGAGSLDAQAHSAPCPSLRSVGRGS